MTLMNMRTKIILFSLVIFFGLIQSFTALSADISSSEPYRDGKGDKVEFDSNSDIISDSGFTPSDNINYLNYLGSPVSSIDYVLGQFTLRDGGGVPDLDITSTILNDLTFSIANWENVNSIAIFNTSNVKLDEEVVTGPSVTFTSLGLVANDDAQVTFKVICTFNTAVTDNDPIDLTITSATSSGSQFIAPDAGGAGTQLGKNVIQVIASSLTFGTQPPSTVEVLKDLTTSPVALAVDVNSNTDLDYLSPAVVTNAGGLLMSNQPVSFVNGALVFPSNFQYGTIGDGTLTVTVGPLSTVSNTVTVICINPVLNPIAVANTNCLPQNGSVSLSMELDGIPQPNASFTFEWFTGVANIPANTLGMFANGDITDLAPGDYFVEATYNPYRLFSRKRCNYNR